METGTVGVTETTEIETGGMIEMIGGGMIKGIEITEEAVMPGGMTETEVGKKEDTETIGEIETLEGIEMITEVERKRTAEGIGMTKETKKIKTTKGMIKWILRKKMIEEIKMIKETQGTKREEAGKIKKIEETGNIKEMIKETGTIDEEEGMIEITKEVGMIEENQVKVQGHGQGRAVPKDQQTVRYTSNHAS